MTKDQAKELRAFKDEYAQRKGFEDWNDFLSYCDYNAFNESEVGYDELMFEYGFLMYMKGVDSENVIW